MVNRYIFIKQKNQKIQIKKNKKSHIKIKGCKTLQLIVIYLQSKRIRKPKLKNKKGCTKINGCKTKTINFVPEAVST